MTLKPIIFGITAASPWGQWVNGNLWQQHVTSIALGSRKNQAILFHRPPDWVFDFCRAENKAHFKTSR